jgi:hypothetical protein
MKHILYRNAGKTELHIACCAWKTEAKGHTKRIMYKTYHVTIL